MSGIVKPQVLSPLNRSHPLADGLVGFWPMLEGSGGIVHDYSGRNNHGTLAGMVPANDWVGGRHGAAVRFSQATGKITLPAAVASSITKSGTFTLCCLVESCVATGGTILDRYAANDDRSTLYTVGAHVEWKYYNGSSYVVVSSPLDATDSYAIVAINNGGTLSLWVNGILAAGNKSLRSAGYETCSLGYSKQGRLFSGAMGLFGVAQRVWAPEEIRAWTADPLALLRPAGFSPELWYSGGGATIHQLAGALSGTGGGLAAGSIIAQLQAALSATGGGTAAGQVYVLLSGALAGTGGGAAAGLVLVPLAGALTVLGGGAAAGAVYVPLSGALSGIGGGFAAGSIIVNVAGILEATGGGAAAGVAIAQLVGQLLAEGGGAAAGSIIVDLSGALAGGGGGSAAGTIYPPDSSGVRRPPFISGVVR